MTQKTNQNPWTMDVRVRERNLKSGALTDKDLEKFLSALPDVAEQAEPFGTAQPALAQPQLPPPPPPPPQVQPQPHVAVAEPTPVAHVAEHAAHDQEADHEPESAPVSNEDVNGAATPVGEGQSL